MRHNSSRSRSKNNKSGNRRSASKTQVYDSNGPDVRIRGTAHQVCEKYLVLSKDAASSGDLILAESYRQHAEHYQRIINSFNEAQDAQNARQQQAQSQANGNNKEAEAEDDLGLPETMIQEAKSKQDASALEDA
jgi:hypothetical protein